MTLLNQTVCNFIKFHANNIPHEEICGFIIRGKQSIFAFPCQNRKQDRAHQFQIFPIDYLKATTYGDIIGFYHSRKENEQLSNIDILNARNNNLICVMYCLKSDSFVEYDPQTGYYPLSKYIGREFQIGRNDCYSLVKDYYKNDLNIILKDFERDDSWYNNDPAMIMRNYYEHFQSIFEDIDEPKQHNVIVLNI